jgi:SAM-dependent methyltransferase
METGRVCPACCGALVTWRRAPAAEPGLAPIALARCTDCGSAVTLGPPEPDAHEAGDYAPGAPRGAGLAAPLLRAFDRRRLTLLRRAMPPPARLVDAGAGRGRFVAAAVAAGYAASGVEPGARGVAAAREAYGVTLVRAGVEDAAIARGSVDVVSLWHVLEHVEDAGAALRAVHAWLAPGGALLVGVPDLGSWQARLAGDRWYHLDLPRHRTHFTRLGLAALLARSGFEVEATTHVLAEHNPFGMWLAGVSRLTRRPSYLYHLLKRNAPARSPDLAVTLASLPLLPVAAVLELVAGLAGRGGTLAMTARRG